MINLIQKSNKCSKQKCSNELDKVLNDKKLQLEKEKLIKKNDLDAYDKLITNIYSNKNQNNLDLCSYKKCKKVNKTLQNNKLKELDDKIKLYNIIFPKKYKEKYNELIRLTSKTYITDDEYLKITLLFQILTRFISGKYMEYIKSSADAFSNYYNCGRNKCEGLFNEVKQDKELFKKKISTFSIKDDKKRKGEDLGNPPKKVSTEKKPQIEIELDKMAMVLEGGYKQKYLKYKQKYLLLKEKI